MTGTTVMFRGFEVTRVGTSIDMRAAAAGQLPGVTAIGVTVEDAARPFGTLNLPVTACSGLRTGPSSCLPGT
jgi:hypothetical protein